ncbi:hypothetical protein [Actinokineospora globicatena]|uniref:Uncharacterized protein n=1 Tax=Actinokineospora globicatena TaxID=103729 RepID=A0A9W6V4I6_9PSEU|nr:hypothetical protein [Actinokineospora globicatena]GLW89240.1 hypothetical protein Aglo03_00560 [Actinokineospora globicatena]
MLRRQWARPYTLVLTVLSAAVGFTGVCAGAALLRSWTLVFLGITAICLGLALSAALTGNSSLQLGGAVLSGFLFVTLVGTAGLVILVEWVAFALVGALAVAAIPLRGGRGYSTEYLCARWTATLLTLNQAKTPTEAAGVLRIRQRYLDELERRHPEAFSRWLTTPDVDPATILARRQNSL